MLRRFFRNRDGGGIATALYGVIVARARTPQLYSALGVPDTVDGRFEMVALHLYLVLDRLERGDEAAREVGQEVFDLFCADMDRSLREMGVGDLSVPKRVKRMAAGYYGRAGAYGPPVRAGDTAGLAEALERNVFAGAAQPLPARALAAYVLASAGALAQSPVAEVLAGEVVFPDPSSFLHERVGP